MGANFCLLPETTLKFKQGLKDGTINPQKMAGMSSEERRAFLETFVGKNHARAVNAAFESKLLLKNQKQGYITWAKQVSGITPATRRDLIAKIERMNRVLDPQEGEQFMSDLTAQRLGVDVTEEEAQKIADLSRNVSKAEALKGEGGTFPSKEARMKYGYTVEDLTDYVAGLKQSADKFKLSDIRDTSVAGKAGLLGKFVSKTAGNMKSLSASLDDSAIFRQGWKTMWTHPGTWAKNSADTFRTLAKTVGGKNVMREVNADIISRPNYDRMVKAKLAIKNPEEAFPESLAEKVPGLGRLYKASESAYTGFVYKTRADVFDKYIDIAKAGGIDINNKKELEAIGNLVNSLTGRGNLGAAERVANSVNNVFFSPRFLKSNLDTLTQPFGAGGAKTAFARKQAAKNLVKMAAGTATVLVAADKILPGSVEWDPRSSDFGKIRVKDTRFDVSGGMSSLIVFLSRIATRQSKSTSSGAITNLDSDQFGSKKSTDVGLEFLTNKLSPAASTIKHLYEGKDFSGNKTDIYKEAGRVVTPIGIQNAVELLTNPNAANALAGIIADSFGIGTNTYSAAGGGGVSTWSKSTSKEMSSFKSSVGESKFNDAAKQFDDQYNEWISRVAKEPSYDKLSDDEKKSLITQKKSLIKKDIFKNYGFEYISSGKKDTSSDLLK